MHFTRDFIYDFCFGFSLASYPAYIQFLWLSLIVDGTTAEYGMLTCENAILWRLILKSQRQPAHANRILIEPTAMKVRAWLITNIRYIAVKLKCQTDSWTVVEEEEEEVDGDVN